MKALGFAVITYLFLTSPLYADTTESPDSVTQNTQFCEFWGDVTDEYELLGKRGCCSWHEGVCGCSGGRITCCDGTLSPSCTCHKADPPFEVPEA